MLKKLGRLTLLFMAITGQLEIVLLLAIFAEKSDITFTYGVRPTLRATAWHLRHGNTITFDGHTFHLPHSWYPNPDSRPGELDLQHATFGSLDFDTIHLATGEKLDDPSLQKEFAKSANHLNERSAIPDEWREETLRGRDMTFHCIANDEMVHSLICQAAGSNLRVVVITGRKSHTDALNILETSE